MVTRLFHEYLFKLVVTVAVTGTVAAFALINKYWTWPNAVVGVVLLLSGLLSLMDRLGIGPSTKSRVRDWLDSSAFQIQTIQDTNEFHFRVMDNVFISTDILQAKAGAPVFLASAKHLATPAQVAVFKSFTDPQRAAFWKKVRLELLRYGVELSDLKLEGDGVTFSDNFIITRTSSARELLQRLLFVRSGARLYHELLLELHDASQPSAAIAEAASTS